MKEKLFSYGTLQLEKVQIEHFGRKLNAKPDVLEGYEVRDCLIKDTKVVKVSGKTIHPIACFTGDPDSKISGMLLEVTSHELQKADKYEVDDYKRVKCTLRSGEQAWVYVQRSLNLKSNF